MDWKKVYLFLLAVLLVLNVFMAFLVQTYRRETTTVPASALEEMTAVLEKKNIVIREDAVPRELVDLTILSGAFPADYRHAVAERLSASAVERTYSVPDGEILIMENGDRFSFASGFGFTLTTDRAAEIPAGFSPKGSPSGRERRTIEKRLRAVFGLPSENASASVPSVTCRIEKLLVDDASGLWSADLIQTAENVPLTGCRLQVVGSGEDLLRVSGGWCFSVPDESRRTQLLDQLNALYIAQTALAGEAVDGKVVVIASVRPCLYPYCISVTNRFWLIPAWSVETFDGETLVINAVDGSLCG